MRYLAFATLTAAVLCAAAPSFAQAVDELTVTGRGALMHDRPLTLSRTVSYSDLDLRLAGDRQRLEHRINDTARQLCTELNEASPSNHNIGKSCQDLAVGDAMSEVRRAYVVADTSTAPGYVDRYGADVSATVPDQTAYGATYDNGPIPDTAENRALYGGPMSRAGQRTSANGH
jgi:UrcA family protein